MLFFLSLSLSLSPVPGDNLGDAEMARGMEGIECIVKIGLLHDHVEQRMQQFQEAFDIVLLNDASMEFVHELVKDIVAGKDSSSKQ